jgi:hypothetical protein
MGFVRRIFSPIGKIATRVESELERLASSYNRRARNSN